MNLFPDDPMLTAYALGELPVNEAAEVERAVQGSPELQAAVAEIRQTAELLKQEFAAESGPGFSEKEKAAVIATVAPDNIVALPHRSFWRTAGLSAVAAAILCVMAWQFLAPEKSRHATSERQEMAVLETRSSAPDQPAPADKIANAPVTSAPAEFAIPHESLPEPKAETAVASTPAPARVRELADVAGRTDLSSDRTLTAPQPRESGLVQPAKEKLAKKQEAQDPVITTFESAGVVAVPEAKAPAQGVAAAAAVARPASPATSTLRATSPLNRTEAYAFDSRVARGFEARLDGDLPRKEYYTLHRNFDDGGSARIPKQQFDSAFARYRGDAETARYPKYKENEFQRVSEQPLSTFSIDVDTASYANVRRFLNEGRMPPRDAVRIEEMINYFSYDYPQPKGDEPFSVNMEMASCPWAPQHQLLRVGLKGKEIAEKKRPASNFVFLIDVSGSMSPQERLPLIKQALRMLVKRMTENDRIAIVVYASSSGTVLESTSAVKKEKILEALDRLEAGGSTNGGQGIKQAYALAEENFIKGGVNRVILCTDGDFNVGITDQSELIELIQRKAKSGVFLSVLGVGTDNYKDALMQKLADKGNGNYHYLDSVEEAHKVLVQQMNGTLVTIAKDVKIQIEFNPAKVRCYRLIGYEKRMLEAEDFNNDKKDAGEIGAGHTVTALYEIVPAGVEMAGGAGTVDELKYQRKAAPKEEARAVVSNSDEMLTLKLRYKKPEGDKSILREHTLRDSKKKLTETSTDFRFAAAVASFGMVLKDSDHKGESSFGSVLKLAREATGDDEEGYRAEFINLVKKARELKQDHDEEDE